MDKLEMIKAFAKLEGLELYRDNITKSAVDSITSLCPSLSAEQYCDGLKADAGSRYNPITDLALNCAARDKYEIEIEYNYMGFRSFKDIGNDEYLDIECKSKAELPHAVIECILKSKGMWHD